MTWNLSWGKFMSGKRAVVPFEQLAGSDLSNALSLLGITFPFLHLFN